MSRQHLLSQTITVKVEVDNRSWPSMPRRKHKKSRRGCKDCKRRHIKCDESQPKCVNCVTAGINCSFESDIPPRVTTLQEDSGPAESLPTKQDFNLDNGQTAGDHQFMGEAPIDADSSHVDDFQPANMLHMELILHWRSENLLFSAISGEQIDAYHQTSIKYALMYPYLMHAILAISALHLSITHPERSAIYRTHATQLQSRAMSDFNKDVSNVNDTTVVPAFLFSSLTGLHRFCEAFVPFRSTFDETLDSLAHCISLLRGIRIVIGPYWETLRNSELKPIFDTLHQLQNRQEIEGTENLRPVRTLVDTADIGAASKVTYSNAIDELQKLYNVQANLKAEKKLSANVIMTWLVTIEPDYVELLNQRRPEALIILAYFAVILHYQNTFWGIGESGAFLVQSISTYLGKHWEGWMAWPNAVVSESVGNTL